MRMKRRNGPIPRKSLNARHVTEVLDDFGTPTITEVPFTLTLCTVQPFVGDDFILGSDGLQNKDVFTVFTETPLQSGKEGSEIKADEVEINGEWYIVYKAQPWQVGIGLDHYCATVILKDEGL